MLGMSAGVYAQSTISGTVKDADTDEPLAAATVVVKGTQRGVSTGFDGSFRIRVEQGDSLQVSFVGYEPLTVPATDGIIVELVPQSNVLGEVVVSSGIVDIAKVRETPVASTLISPAEISLKVGNQEFPEIMNTTPGVYATKQGGGYGDSRITIRGFDQRNTSFLINGQPVNDMENGWVYWSNWQGLTDVASGIQIQRGLGASRLAVPSVGGTVSIFTKTAQVDPGASVAQTLGNDGYTKTAVSWNSGKNEKGWATSLLLSYWAGNGYVYNTAGEGWTYFAAVGYEPEGSNHQFNLSIMGAAQWHHQRDVEVSIRDYQNFGESGIDTRWNTNGGSLNGEEFNMRRNFYNKPLATFNWDWDINEIFTLNTSLYASAGRGGGTGPRGQNFFDSQLDILPYQRDLTEHYLENGNGVRGPGGRIDFDRIVELNREYTSGYTGELSDFEGRLIGSNGYSENGVNNVVLIRRASMNSHNWFGAISNLEAEFGDFRASIGVDLRDYTGYHYRVVTDLMGLDGYFSTGNENSAGQIIESTIDPTPFNDTGIAGPKIDYYNIGYVGWQGLNGMLEYSHDDKLTAVIQGGLSNKSYQREDFFDQPTFPLSEEVDVLGGYVKGGANYNLTDKQNVFFNTGFISRQPNFDAVFPGFANAKNPNLQNEEIFSFELGYGYIGNDFRLNVNAYSTTWSNRFESVSFDIGDGTEGTAQFDDIDSRHNGIEIETEYRTPVEGLKVTGMLSVGDWRYTKDFTSTIFDEDQNEIGQGTLYLKDAKVGDAGQFVLNLGADYQIIRQVSVDANYRYVDNLYADYSITDSDFTNPDNDGALKLPSYGLLDLGTTVRFDLFGRDASFRVNVNNALNTTYIAESNSNIHATSSSQTWNGIDTRNYVWFGFGTTWNATLKYNF
ncbi:Outer membrane receptor proteins, mostly Fe transport [Gracilimonas mengyeensis]|uniref:Outer membrane receptor proteins, mostly Fe transport n=2 Tax=Gracilimonas mengyeensis TaxID=1302730 RepID=A0A521EIR2_9BACT|nr:Outer membrane receptor proteins, mostly Fe transport [Gracilimonas mengyeensis]